MSSRTTGFESLLEAVPDAIVCVDESGLIRFVNSRAESLFGYGRADLVGGALETLVPEPLRQAHAEHRKGLDAAEMTRPMGAGLNLRGLHRDGTEFPVDVSLARSDTGDGLVVIAAVRDMSHYRKAEEDRRKLSQLAAMVEHSGDAIISSTLDGTVTQWNPAAEQLYGYSRQEIIGRPITLLTPEDRTDEVDHVQACVAAGQPASHLETIRVRRGGAPISVSLTVSPIRDQSGTVVGASTISRDVGERAKAVEAARSMIESSLDSLVAISPEGTITDVNEATVKATGAPREELIGTAFSDYFTEPAQANAIYQMVFAEGMARDYPLTIRHRDGTVTEVLYNASVHRDRAGKVLGVFAAARDVTKQNQAQRATAEQQSQALVRLAELERFQRLTVGRELKMIELKKEIEYLRKADPGHGGERR